MKVDIIVPVYNGADHLMETLLSIKNQYLKFNSVIIINDSSSDDSQKIIDEFLYTSENFISLINPKNLGLGESLRNGLVISNADFVCILGHDDCLPLDYLQKSIHLLNDQVSILHTDYRLIDSVGRYIPSKKSLPLKIPYCYELIKGNFLYLQSLGNYISTVGIILNRQSLIKIDAFQTIKLYDRNDNTILTYDEYNNWVLLSREGKLIHMRNNQPYYRLHENNMSKILALNLEYHLSYLNNKRLALKYLLELEPLPRVLLFVILVYLPVIIWLSIRLIINKTKQRSMI